MKGKVINFIKNNIGSLPFPIGQLLANIPFRFRPGIGSVYASRKKDLNRFEQIEVEQKKGLVFSKIKPLVEHAYSTTSFYRFHYDKHGFHPDMLMNFDDIQRIPVVNKADLLSFDIEERSSLHKGRYVVNTGGSSGRTLSFYITPDAVGHEWAHMHKVWNKLGYKPNDLKLTFGGVYRGDKAVAYDAIRHQYNYNLFKHFPDLKDQLLSLFNKQHVRYLHGYPSAIYDFALFCSTPGNEDLIRAVKKNLRGILYGSEFPISHWREFCESIFEVDSISWYGHTERAVLAYEENRAYNFVPFFTYGYAESVKAGTDCHLIGTSYYNYASPLIRYDTEDIIKPTIVEEGMLREFQIEKGRVGEFILDRKGKKIALTALVFGRHHRLFDLCSHIQISQNQPGFATVLYTPLNSGSELSPANLFDSEGVEIVFDFKCQSSPIKTPAGKVKLLVTV